MSRTPDDFDRYLEEQCKDPEFRALWEADEAEFQLRRALIEARQERGLTQKQLAEAVGMNQRAISRLEMGNTNPTLKTMERLAKGLGKKLEIRFV